MHACEVSHLIVWLSFEVLKEDKPVIRLIPSRILVFPTAFGPLKIVSGPMPSSENDEYTRKSLQEKDDSRSEAPAELYVSCNPTRNLLQSDRHNQIEERFG